MNTHPETHSLPLVVGLTGCATGVAHTYLARDKLIATAKKLGTCEVKIETHGAQGVRTPLTNEEIARAQFVIVASDVSIPLDRFIGKKIVYSTPGEAIHHPEKLLDLQQTLQVHVGDKKSQTKSTTESSKRNGMRHLMNGVSFMIPFVVFGGISIAIAAAVGQAVYGNNPVTGQALTPPGSFLGVLNQLGVFGLVYMMLPILAGYTAISIAGRAALAPAIITMMAGEAPAAFGVKNFIWDWNGVINVPGDATVGFLGAIAIGYGVGFLIKWINSWKIHKNLLPVMPIFVIPILGTMIPALLTVYIFGAPIAELMSLLNEGLTTWQESSQASISFIIGFGIVAGIFQGIDFGGPFGKVLFAFSTGLIATHPEFMGAQSLAIPVAPLGMAFAVFFDYLFKTKTFPDAEDKNLSIAAGIMGTIGISEGAIPFAIKDPLRVIIASILGSIFAAIWGFSFGIIGVAAHGGPIVAFLGALDFEKDLPNGNIGGQGNVIVAGLVGIAGMLLGGVITGLSLIAFKKWLNFELFKKLFNLRSSLKSPKKSRLKV